jgi:lipoprotein-releasing system ATP-binding protein
MIQIKNIHKAYDQLQVLKGIDLSINKSDIISIVGASGAGKSTLLHIVGTLDKADKGQILFNNNDIANFSEKKLSVFRNKHIGFVFQFHHLLPEFTALENICIPAFVSKKPRKEAELRAMELMDILGIKEREKHKPNELSGGEQQRVAVARALINNPDIILADEPSGNLDSKNAKSLHQLFFDLREQLQQTFLIATHNEDLANLSDKKLFMKDGKII